MKLNWSVGYFRDMGKPKNLEKNAWTKTTLAVRALSNILSESFTKSYQSISHQCFKLQTCAKVSLGDVKSSHQKCYEESNLHKPKPNDTYKSSQLDEQAFSNICNTQLSFNVRTNLYNVPGQGSIHFRPLNLEISVLSIVSYTVLEAIS